MGALVCFDVDGCLIDSDVPMMAALNEALSVLGMPPVGLAQLQPHLGPPLLETLHGLLSDLGLPTVQAEALSVVYRQAYERTSLEDVSVHAGIPEMLARLRADGHELRVVSSKPPRYSEPLLQAAELLGFFSSVHGPLGAETEPKDVTLARALQRSSLATHVYMVGDTEADILAAEANDVVSIAVAWGYATVETLQAARPDHLAATADDVAGIIEATRHPS